MNVSTNTLKQICRICLHRENKDKMISLVDSSMEDGLSYHGKAVTVFASITLQVRDKLPNMMCQQCLMLLKYAIMFKMTCEGSQKKLERIFQTDTQNKRKPSNHNANRSEPRSFDSPTKVKRLKVDSTLDMCDKMVDMNYSSDDDFFRDDSTKDDTKSSFNDVDTLDELEGLINNDYSFLALVQSDKTRTITKPKCRKEISDNNSKYICNICNKVLMKKYNYESHMQQHTQSFKFVCEQCGKGYPTPVTLNYHLVKIHGIGSYIQCPHCSYKASRRFDFKEHMRKHTGERPYTCEKCGLSFYRQYIYQKHVMLHEEKKVKCKMCPKTFISTIRMKEHLNSCHERLYEYLCPKCGVTYAKNTTVRKHLVTKHGIPRHLQGKVMRIVKSRSDKEQ